MNKLAMTMRLRGFLLSRFSFFFCFIFRCSFFYRLRPDRKEQGLLWRMLLLLRAKAVSPVPFHTDGRYGNKEIMNKNSILFNSFIYKIKFRPEPNNGGLNFSTNFTVPQLMYIM
jgi:hypothetical protein